MEWPYFIQVDADGSATQWEPEHDKAERRRRLNWHHVRDLIERAHKGDAGAGAEVLRSVRTGIDAGRIVATAPEYALLLPYLANALSAYLDDGVEIAPALNVDPDRRPGHPTGSTNVDHTSYAALMVLLSRKLGSANKAQDRVLEVFENTKRAGKYQSPISKSTLQKIYRQYEPVRDYDRDLLVSMLTPELRKLFKNSLR